MKYTANTKDLMIIGYAQSLLTQDSVEVTRTFIQSKITIITPNNFIGLKNKKDYQYFIGFGLDLIERKTIVDIIDNEDLDTVSYIHPTAQVHRSAKIGKGVFIMNFSTVMQGTEIGNHSIVEMYCLVSHNSTVGKNCILHSGTMIAGSVSIGNNCMFNFKSSVINKIKITDNVTVGATSTVTKDIVNSGTYVGTPARKIK